MNRFLYSFFLVFSVCSAFGSGSITVKNRAGNDVSNSTSITSDHIHIELSGFGKISQSVYQLVEGTSPSSWTGKTEYEFYEDVYFYKKNKDQHIRIFVEDESGTVEKILTLKGGTLSAPPDDPILPVDFVKLMGRAGLIVEGDDYADVMPEKSVVAMKKAGISHVRIHIGRLEKDKETPNPFNEAYYENLDRWVEQISRHGMVCHLGNKTNSVAEVTLPGGKDDPGFYDAFDEELTEWWGMIAERYRYASHRFAFHSYLETGALDMFKVGNAHLLNPHYKKLSDAIRAHCPTRNVIFAPGRLNSPTMLDDLTLPYTAGDIYYFSDFHKGFAGGGWHPGEEEYETNIAAALDWMQRTKVPLIMSACNITDRIPYPTVKRVAEIHELFSDINAGIRPIPITFLKLNDFWDDDDGWETDFDIRARFEAINGDESIDPDDPDGDFLSTEYELQVSGTDPYNSDSDQDNISDFVENAIAQLDPNNMRDGSPLSDPSIEADLDGDGISNAKELSYAIYNISKKTVIQQLDIADPNDAESSLVGKIPNVWESILGLNIDDDKTFVPGGTDGSKNYDDESYDHDGDGISTLQEVQAHTWPGTHDERNGDTDFDFPIVGLDDYMPFINDGAYIVGYEFNDVKGNVVQNQAKQGSQNNGTVVGELQLEKGALLISPENRLEIPNADFRYVQNRSLHFRFLAGDVERRQVLHSEGDETAGISLAITGGNVTAAAWNSSEEVTLTAPADAEKWYALTVQFDGAKREFLLSLFADNRIVSRTKTALPFASLNLSSAAPVVFGASSSSTKISQADGTMISISSGVFSGYLDDMHIYNRVLSEKEVSLLSRNDLYPKKDPAVPTDGLKDALTSIETKPAEHEHFCVVYPNPVRDRLFVKTTGTIEQVVVRNLWGATVNEGQDVSILSAGSYVAQVTVDGKTFYCRFSKL